jgi:hypothetical protein
MSSFAAELALLLGTVHRPGDLFAAGTAELLAPSLKVEGVGPVALPLLPEQAERIIGVAEAAPYGPGEVFDRSVTLSEWRRPDGKEAVLGAVPVEEETELSPPDACDDLAPDEEHFHEATGNEASDCSRC